VLGSVAVELAEKVLARVAALDEALHVGGEGGMSGAGKERQAEQGDEPVTRNFRLFAIRPTVREGLRLRALRLGSDRHLRAISVCEPLRITCGFLQNLLEHGAWRCQEGLLR